MKRYKRILCMVLIAVTAVMFGACGKKADKKSENPYEGRTLKEILDEGFKYSGCGSMEDKEEEKYIIVAYVYKEEEYIDLQWEVSRDIYKQMRRLDDFDEKKEFVIENFSDKKATEYDYTVQYLINSKKDLDKYVDKGAFIRYEKLEGKTVGALMEEGYEYDSCNRTNNECIVTMLDQKEQEYWMVIDLSEKEEEVEDLFFSGETILKDYTVVECYSVK